MTTSAVLAYTVTATLHGTDWSVPVDLLDGSRITLDEEWSPFAQGVLEVAASDISTLLAIDPREPIRAELHLTSHSRREGTTADLDAYLAAHGITTAGQWDAHFGAGAEAQDIDALLRSSLNPLAGNDYGTGSANFDLVVSSIDLDPVSGNARITVNSDESLLHEYKRVDPAAYNPASGKVLEAVNYTLAQIGAGPLAAVEITVEASQLHTMEFEDGGVVGCSPGTNVVIANSTTQHHSGAHSLRATTTAAIPAFGVYARKYFNDLAPGRQHTVRIWVYSGSARRLQLTLRDQVTGLSGGGQDLAPTTGWRELTAVYTPTTTAALIEISDVTGAPSGAVIYIDQMIMFRDRYVENTDTMTVAPDSLIWNPGDSAWDYIAPPLQAAGLRLWADERRRWRLTAPHEYQRNGFGLGNLVLGGDDIIAIGSRIDRTDDGWFDAAILTYEWTTLAGTAAKQVDSFALDDWTKAYSETIRRPWPGPGAAEQLVRRANARGRQVPSTAISMPTVYPGDILILNSGVLPPLNGRIKSIEFDLARDEMTITPRDLETT